MPTLRDDRGSVTIEAALNMVTLVAVTAAIVGAIATMSAHLTAVSAAGAAARSHAIGIDYQPARDDILIDVSISAGLVTVTAAVPAPLATMTADAVYPVESIP